jgi:anti-sigma B factor antagonist
MGFHCERESLGDDVVLYTVTGELDLKTAERFRRTLESCRREVMDHVVVDLTACTFMDSTGLGMLVAAQKQSRSPLNLVLDVDSPVARVFVRTGLDRLFILHDNAAAAVDAAATRLVEHA